MSSLLTLPAPADHHIIPALLTHHGCGQMEELSQGVRSLRGWNQDINLECRDGGISLHSIRLHRGGHDECLLTEE